MDAVTEPVAWSDQLFELRALIRFVARVGERLDQEPLKAAIVRADAQHIWVMRAPNGDLLPSMKPLAQATVAREVVGGIAVEVLVFAVEPCAKLRYGQLAAYYNNMGSMVRTLSLDRLGAVATVGLALDCKPEPYHIRCP
jgi:hypothetical protein